MQFLAITPVTELSVSQKISRGYRQRSMGDTIGTGPKPSAPNCVANCEISASDLPRSGSAPVRKSGPSRLLWAHGYEPAPAFGAYPTHWGSLSGNDAAMPWQDQVLSAIEDKGVTLLGSGTTEVVMADRIRVARVGE